MSYLERVSSHPVTPEMIITVHDIVSRFRPQSRKDPWKHFECTTLKLLKHAGPVFRPADIPALYFRLQALVGLILADAVPEWTRRNPSDDVIFIAPSVFAAAALADLNLHGALPAFDLDQFRSLVLRLAENEGRA